MEWPDLSSLNGGNEFDANSLVTPTIFNYIVQALKYLHGDAEPTSSYDYTQSGSMLTLRDAPYVQSGSTLQIN